MQADPFIQAAGDTQSYNRYSYVRNNPLNATDPSGYNWLKKTWNKIRPYVGAIVAIVATYYCGSECGQLAWAWIGAGSGAAGAAANGGNVAQGALTGLVTAAVFHGIGQSFNGTAVGKGGDFWSWTTQGGAAHVAAHALAGGILSALQGGEFGHGFVSAGLTKALNINRIMSNDAGATADTVRAVIAGVVGGTISKITGGKFANGAITASMAQAFNGNSSLQGDLERKARMSMWELYIAGTTDIDTLEGARNQLYGSLNTVAQSSGAWTAGAMIWEDGWGGWFGADYSYSTPLHNAILDNFYDLDGFVRPALDLSYYEDAVEINLLYKRAYFDQSSESFSAVLEKIKFSAQSLADKTRINVFVQIPKDSFICYPSKGCQ